MAEHLATQPTYGLSLIKKAIHAAADNNLDEQLILGGICKAWQAVPVIIVRAFRPLCKTHTTI